jgi:RNA polymerase sigma factor (sigma-70 family)
VRTVHSAAAATPEAQLYERHSDMVYRFCLRTLGSHEDAEDALQTTFFQAVRAMRRGIVPTFEQAWLLAIAKNECRSRQRANYRRRRLELVRDPQTLAEVARGPDDPDATLIGVQEALTRLPEAQRRALLLREWQGRSYDEIAEELGTTLPAVEALLFRARRALARALGAEAKSRRRAVDVASLLAGVKSALGGGTAVKVAAGVVAAAAVGSVAGDAEQRPARTLQPPPVRVQAQGDEVSSHARARTPTAEETRRGAVARRGLASAAAPRSGSRAARPGIRRGDYGAAPVTPTTAPAPPATAPEQQPAAPAAPERSNAGPITAPSTPAPTSPPSPLVPDVSGAVPELPTVEVPQLPQIPGPPEQPEAPQLPLPDVPDVPGLPGVPDLPILP